MSNPKFSEKMNAFYGQSGGMTAVTNTTACAVIETARQHQDKISKVFAGHQGIYGLLNEELYDTSVESAETIHALQYLPGAVFGSCRYKLPDFAQDSRDYEKILSVLKAHRVGYFFYHGGNDSTDTVYKISQFCQQRGFPLVCIAIPKTIDNDLRMTDQSPGFASVAKYIATVTRELHEDLISLIHLPQVYILEVMGRHAGWIAAASGLAREKPHESPHMILFPEILFDQKKFLIHVQYCVKRYGYCFITTSESLKDIYGHYLADTGQIDVFGHHQLSGVALVLANLIDQHLGYHYRYSVAGCLERASRHIGSPVDLAHAYAVGQSAVEFAIKGKNNVCPVIIRTSNQPYRWRIGKTALKDIANYERNMPRSFITQDGFGITKQCRDYLMPLIQGEDFPPFENGLPKYIRLKKKMVQKKT